MKNLIIDLKLVSKIFKLLFQCDPKVVSPHTNHHHVMSQHHSVAHWECAPTVHAGHQVKTLNLINYKMVELVGWVCER
jgi:hypothetical protein